MANPQPAKIKELKGNPGKRPIPREPEFTSGAPKPPGDIAGEAFAEWSRVVPELDRAGLLTTVDRAYLVAYCEAWASFCEAREMLMVQGALIIGRDGGLVRNPAAMVMRDSMDMMLKFGAKFGLSPVDRAKLGKVPEPDEADGPDAKVLKILS